MRISSTQWSQVGKLNFAHSEVVHLSVWLSVSYFYPSLKYCSAFSFSPEFNILHLHSLLTVETMLDNRIDYPLYSQFYPLLISFLTFIFKF